MSDKRDLDFSLLPNIDSMDLFMRHEIDIDEKLKEDGLLPEVFERAKASLMFFWETSDKNEDWRNSAFIRGGLNEFYSLEDAAKRDFKKITKNVVPSKIRESRHPLIHLMYLLRHVNVHAKVSSTKAHPISVISTLGDERHEHSYGAIILNSPTINELLACNEAKNYYRVTDLDSVAGWLDGVQCIFGVSEVFRRGLSAYCRELLQSYEKAA